MDFFLKVALNFFQSSSFSSGVAFLQSIRRCRPAHFSGLRKCLALLSRACFFLSLGYLLSLVLCCRCREDFHYLPSMFSCWQRSCLSLHIVNGSLPFGGVLAIILL